MHPSPSKELNKSNNEIEVVKKSTGYLYLLHELANFLNRGLFEFQQFRLLKKLLLHVCKLALKFLQPLPPLLTKPRRRRCMSNGEGSEE